MNAKEVLTEAARLLRDVGWTQHFFARDCYGDGIEPMHPGATCYCMMGAIERASGGRPCLDSDAAIHQLVLKVGPIPNYNDSPGRTKEECIAKLLEAAEL